MREFSLIQQFFEPIGRISNPPSHPDIALGIGDDCALLTGRPDFQLAVSADMLLADVHFFADINPAYIGHKALAVNLSDLAAMGAEPAWFTLSVSLPSTTTDAWLGEFCTGMAMLARQHCIPLVGGDTTCGPLAIALQVAGWVPEHGALTRSRGQLGDDIYVTGELGWPALGYHYERIQRKMPEDTPIPNNADADNESWLALLEGLSGADRNTALQALHQPVPQCTFATSARELVHSAIDISDGLLQDMNHVLSASHLGAVIDVEAVPYATPYTAPCAVDFGQCPYGERLRWNAVNFGDEYQLLMTAPVAHRDALRSLAKQVNIPLTRIGQLVAQSGIRDTTGKVLSVHGYQHF